MDKRQDRNAGPVPEGLTSGTLVETETGWRPMEKLAMGDRVFTMDGSPRPIRWIARAAYGADLPDIFPEGLILVPGGAIGNCQGFYLLPETRILVTGSAVEALSNDSAALLRAADLAGHGGIEPAMPVDGIEIVALGFDDEEIVFANTGVLVHCPPSGRQRTPSRGFPVLGPRAAHVLMACRFPDMGRVVATPGKRTAAA